jgi:hypothetical protein
MLAEQPPMPVATIPPLNTRRETCALIKCQTTKLHALINEGVLDARKLGGKTLITGESIARLIAGLPSVHS